jgi:glycosyltransferase involved in cell wall biosynthesis
LAGYLPILRSAPSNPIVVCDSHNIESEVMRRYSEHATDRFRRLYARMAAPRLQYFETRTMPKFDAHITVSARDRARLNAMCPGSQAFTVENGVDVKYYREPLLTLGGSRQQQDRKHRVLFVGSMDYHSNINAACQFARDVWPMIYAKSPHLTFTITGCRPAPEVLALAAQPGIEVTGTVPDVRPYLRQALVEVVPLHIGGGTRLKILEAMAARVPVVATPMGAEGLEVRHRREVLVAQTSGEFVHAVLELEADANLRQRLTDAGEQLVESRHDWTQLGAKLWDVHSGLQEQRLGVGIPALSASPGSRAWARGRVAQA